MHTESIERWVHDHTFGQDEKKAGERRTMIVIVITLATMVAEIAAGWAFGSMALLADGLHMGSHTAALAIAAFAYYYTRRHAHDPRFNFGTGKVNSLAAFASAVILAIFAVVMAVESARRFIHPVAIGYNQALAVAVLGLVVNGVCLLILGRGGHAHDGGHAETHAHKAVLTDDHDHDHTHDHTHTPPGPGRRDHVLWSSYLHVLADALTSVFAIVALLGAKYLGLRWLDPVMGVVGAVLVIRWSWTLLRASTGVLLDMQAPPAARERIKKALEADGDTRVSDLHVWAVGPGIYAAEVAVVASAPLDAEGYYNLLPEDLGLVHITVEARRCPSPAR